MHPWRVVPSVAPLAAVMSAAGECWDPVFHFCYVMLIDIREAPVNRATWAWAHSSTGDLAFLTGAEDAVPAEGISAPVVSLLARDTHVGYHVRRRVNPHAHMPFPRI